MIDDDYYYYSFLWFDQYTICIVKFILYKTFVLILNDINVSLTFQICRIQPPFKHLISETKLASYEFNFNEKLFFYFSY